MPPRSSTTRIRSSATFRSPRTPGFPGLGGAKLELTFIDHQGNPSVAQQQALRLINQDKVHRAVRRLPVVLHVHRDAGRGALRHSVRGRRFSAALNITGRGFKWVFRVTPIATDYAATYMRFFDDMKKAGKKIASIAVVNENTDYGTSVAEAIEAAAKQNNLPVAIRIPYSASTTDVSAQVLQLKEKKPDVVIFISYTADSILYIKTMKNLDYLPPMVLGDDSGFSDPSFVPAIADIGQGLMNRSAWDIGKPGIDDLQDQRDVQGQDRPRSRRHLGPQHAGRAGDGGCDQPRRLDRPGQDAGRA